MREHVPVHLAACDEAPPTLVALEGPLPGVCPHVDAHVGRAADRLVAHGTLCPPAGPRAAAPAPPGPRQGGRGGRRRGGDRPRVRREVVLVGCAVSCKRYLILIELKNMNNLFDLFYC